jgi:ElaA protein
MIRTATFTELDTGTLYALLRLRVDVFVVEQRCPYPELDGRDTDPDTVHLWFDGPTAYLRMVTDGDGTVRIGRICTAPEARGTGLAAALITAALDRATGQRITLDAQSHLVGYYERLGFIVDGPEFDDDGIPHTPMRYPATAARPPVR